MPGLSSLARLVLGLVAAAALAGAAAAQAPVFERGEVAIESAGGATRIAVEIARTPEQMAHGLMYRLDLAADAGMLFDLGAEREVSMWMKNTPLALDMLFIAGDGRIARIHRGAVPYSLESIPSGGPVRAVIELKAGTADRLGIREGDRVRHALFASGVEQGAGDAR